MDTELIRKHFERMGARVVFSHQERSWRSVTIDVERRGRDERFKLEFGNKPIRALRVVDVRPADRHLLLMVDEADQGKHKFLCGHDEREWFVAAIPERANASNVSNALAALKPAAVRRARSVILAWGMSWRVTFR